MIESWSLCIYSYNLIIIILHDYFLILSLLLCILYVAGLLRLTQQLDDLTSNQYQAAKEMKEYALIFNNNIIIIVHGLIVYINFIIISNYVYNK